MIRSGIILLIPTFFCIHCYGQNNEKTNNAADLKSLLFPATIAAIGYVVKSIYDIYVDREKRKRTLLEEELKTFYWPVLTRLEVNNAIFMLILDKNNNKDSIRKNIAQFTEKKIILQNHEEIMEIITKNRHLVKFDRELSELMQKYIKHVVIYKSISNSETNHLLPFDLGAPYPSKFNEIIRAKTEELQRILDKKRI